jgi:hypothetical protein
MSGASQLAANEHKGLIKSKMQQELVNFSLSKTISIAKIDTTSIAFQLMAYLTSFQFSNNALSLGHKYSTMFKLVVASVTKEYPKGSMQLPVANNIPSLSLKFIAKSILEGALFAPTTSKAFKLIVVFTLIADFQLVVEYFLIKYSEEAIINNRKFQFIVAFIYSNISLHFCKDCGILCERVKEAIINAIHRNNIPLLAFGFILAFGLNLALRPQLGLRLNHSLQPQLGL